MSIIWLPDEGATTTIERYITENKKAVGVEGLREEWRAVPIKGKVTGFSLPKDKRS